MGLLNGNVMDIAMFIAMRITKSFSKQFAACFAACSPHPPYALWRLSECIGLGVGERVEGIKIYKNGIAMVAVI